MQCIEKTFRRKPMNIKPILAALALSAAATAALPAGAQPTYDNRPYSGAYDRNDMWRGAPDGLQQRIDWLQRRIDRGIADGTLSRSEQRRARYELDALRRDAAVLDRRLNDLSRSLRWARNNGYYRGGVDYDRYRTDYDAARYYRDDPRYTERYLTADDEIYRGSDGRYYCKRNDGTTGLVIGGVGGAVLGNVIDGGSNRVAGTLIGGALGALIGQQVDRSNSDIRCR
jgi:hypothetical protein